MNISLFKLPGRIVLIFPYFIFFLLNCKYLYFICLQLFFLQLAEMPKVIAIVSQDSAMSLAGQVKIVGELASYA